MHAILLATLLTTGVGPAREVPDYPSQQQAAAAIAGELQTGSLMFSNGDCLAVKVYSTGPYTHVAAVVIKDDGPYVYDSQNGAGVRKLKLEQYLTAQAPDDVHLYHPRKPFSEEEAEEFERYLDSRLGTPYAVMHHVTGKRSSRGVHCAEYVTDALMAIDRIHAERPPRVSPSSLAEGVTLYDVYVAGSHFDVERTRPVEPVPDNWCARTWSETKSCMSRCCSKMSAWFLCR